MSLTGRLYKISEQELKNILKEKNYNFDHLQDSIDLSYFATDYLDILSSYSGFQRKAVGEILQGSHFVEIEDGYLGYSSAKEAGDIQSKTLDNISEAIFVDYLDKAERENHLLGSYYSKNDVNRNHIIKYFSDIKRIYGEAAIEGKCLLYRIG